MTWVEPRFSRADVNRAGKALIESGDASLRREARAVLGNWRSAHGFPLNSLAVTLKARAERVSENAIIAQRLKRLVSIENKLLRLPHVRATQIQDIGGARVILPTISEVEELHQAYQDGRSRVFTEQRVDDYIRRPKSSGYRSMHLVFKYDSPRKNEWRNMRVELQIRSRLQHAWAAAVEAVSFFQGQDLKASEGNPGWLRFFVLMGHWMAHEEDSPGVPSVEVPPEQYLLELKELWESLNADVVLTGWAVSTQMIQDVRAAQGAWRFLLHLDANAGQIQVWGYRKKDEEVAAEHVARLEAEHANDPFQHVVLVTVRGMNQLETAYPAFFADTEAFRNSAKRAVREAENLAAGVEQAKLNL